MKLESIRVAERDLGQWCASTGIMNDVLYYPTDIPMSFCKIICSELCWSFVEASMGRCDLVSF